MSSQISAPPQNEFLDARTTGNEGEFMATRFGKVRPTTGWGTFFSNVFRLLFAFQQSGTSAQKPTTQLWLGRPYWDTSLNTMLRLSSVSPVIWSASFSRHKSSAQSVSNSVTLVDDADLTFPVLAGDEYVGRVHLDVGASIKDTGIKVTMAGPSGCTGHIYAEMVTDNIAAGEVFLIRSDTVGAALDFTTSDVGATSLNAGIALMFHITVGSTAGNIRVQFAQSSSSGTAITLRTGSQMRVDKTA